MITVINGYIAPRSKNRRKNRKLKCVNPNLTSARYFLDITGEATIMRLPNGMGHISILPDGTVVTHRFRTKSESPAITINVDNVSNPVYKNQKIHFEKD